MSFEQCAERVGLTWTVNGYTPYPYILSRRFALFLSAHGCDACKVMMSTTVLRLSTSDTRQQAVTSPKFGWRFPRVRRAYAGVPWTEIDDDK